MIIHDLGLIFIHIPKCGGTSIEVGLLKKNGYTNPKFKQNIYGPMEESSKRLYFGSEHRQMVYAPHASISEYKHLQSFHYNKYQTITLVRNPYERFVSSYFFYKRYTQEEIDTVQKLRRISETDELMFNTQTSFLLDGDKVAIDKIFRLEKINKLFKFLRIKGNHSKKTKNRITAKEFYESKPHMKAAVEEVYSIDFENFNYGK